MNSTEQNKGELVIVSAAASDPQSQELREQYYRMRKKVYDARWPGQDFYTDHADEFDLDPRTVFSLYVLDGKVRGGARLLMHEPGSNEQTRSEKAHPHMCIASMFDDIDTANISYCEYSGGALDTDREGLPKHLSTDLTAYVFQQIKSGQITNNGRPIQLLLGIAGKLGLKPFIDGAIQAGIPGIVREDRIQKEENAHVDTLIWPIILSFSDEIPLMTPAREAAGARGADISSYIKIQASALGL